MESATNRNLVTEQKEQKKSQTESQPTANSPLLFAHSLPVDAQNCIFAFVGNVGTKAFKASDKEIKHTEENKNNQALPTSVTFFGNATVLYYDKLTAEIAHHLLFHEKIEETLALLRLPENQKCLYTTVEIFDPHGQRVRNNLVGILSSAGDRNTRDMRPEEKPDGIVERLRSCFQNPADFNTQGKRCKRWN